MVETGSQISAAEEVRPGAGQPGLSAGLTLLLSVTAAASVAGLYYTQPLLSMIAGQFHVSTGLAGLLVTGSQVGYAVGLLLIVPLGDLVSAKKTLAGLVALSSVVLLAAGLSRSFSVLCAVLVLVGLVASAAQLAVPLAAHLASVERRGQATGTVMSGLLLGILLARTVSGAVTELFGSWRAVFFLAAAGSLALAAVLWRSIPTTAPSAQGPYGALLLSTGQLVRSSPLLRKRMALGFVSMAGFSALWTSVAFLLAGEGGTRYHYGEAVIGLFGLAGAAGALGVPLVGRIADRGRGALVATIAWLLVLAGWGLLAEGRSSLVALIAGMVVFDLGVQTVQMSNQHAIYHQHAAERSRATSAYMTLYFLGGMAGSAMSGFLYQRSGWPGVCLAGAGSAAVGLALRLWTNWAERANPAE
ncbi:MAG: MFS transporter [Segniliparus sp.]|uniref:MFS transporter n=1 Tax=Segniliparus sp. TaxID=2804064 RepID=UPI003F2DAF7B